MLLSIVSIVEGSKDSNSLAACNAKLKLLYEIANSALYCGFFVSLSFSSVTKARVPSEPETR